MGLEQVIEDDMVEFLDLETPKQEAAMPARSEEMLMAKRDYFVETKDYLKRNRPEEAKKAFEDLKQRYHDTPESHPEERKRLYGILQQCYIEIFNSINDRNRTSILLQRLEQSPDAVFDVSVKPIDLQHVEKVDQIQLPEFEPLTRQTLQQISYPYAANAAPTGMPAGTPGAAYSGTGAPGAASRAEHKPIPSFDLSMPLPPAGMVQPAQLQAMSQQASRQVPIVNQPVQSPQAPGQPGQAPQAPLMTQQQSDEAKLMREQISILLRRATMVAATSPERSRALLDEIRDKLPMLSPEDSKMVSEKLDLIEESTKAHQARIAFTKKFNDEYVKVTSLCRLKNENAIATFTKLYKQAEGFEHQFGMYQGMFTNRLKDIQKDYFLYDDEELTELLRPYLVKLKRTTGPEQKMAFEELQHFIRTLPPSHQRDRLQQIVQQLHAKRPAAPAQHIAPSPEPEDPFQQPIKHFVKRLRLAVNRKDTNSYIAILEEFARYANKQPAAVKEQLLAAIDQLRKKVRPADEEAILSLVRPHLRRIASARASHDSVELGLALESFTDLIRSLPESQEKTVLEGALAQIEGS